MNAIFDFLNNLVDPGRIYDLMTWVVQDLLIFQQIEGDVITTIYDLITPLALAILLCFCLTDIMQAAMREGRDVTVQIVMMPLLKFVICAVFMDYGMTLISKVLNMSNYAVNNWTGLDAFSATYLSAEDMWGAWNGISGFLFKLLIKFSMMIWALISGLIAVVVIAVQVMSIKVEVCLRCCFLPLAIANCCGHEHHGGLAYIKRLLACMLYMVGIIICINVSGRVSASLMTGAANGGIIGPIDIARWWIACIAGPFAAVGSIAVMKSLLHEAMS